MSTMLMEQDEWIEQEDLFEEDASFEEEFLKGNLIDRIECLYGVERLRELESYIDEHFPDCVYELTPEEERSIDEGLAELDAGLGIPGEEVKRKTQEWLRNYGKSVG